MSINLMHPTVLTSGGILVMAEFLRFRINQMLLSYSLVHDIFNLNFVIINKAQKME